MAGGSAKAGRRAAGSGVAAGSRVAAAPAAARGAARRGAWAAARAAPAGAAAKAVGARPSALGRGLGARAGPAGKPRRGEAARARAGIAIAADAAWILTCSALVLFMTLPGLSAFYGGLVRRKNQLSVFMQCLACACVASVMWFAFGYSLCFTDAQAPGSPVGGLSKAFMQGMK